MPTFPPYFMLMVVSLPIVMAMPEPISEEGWEPSANTPPTLPYPPVDSPGRSFHFVGDNETDPPAEALEAYCQMLLQSPSPVPPEHMPWFCLCTHCQSSQGPKGDRGDRGPPGKAMHRA